MSNDDHSVPMKRFWFCTYREDVLFHARPDCPDVKNNISDERDLDQLPTAHIPIDSSVVGSPPKIKFCKRCGVEDPFI